MVSVCFTDASGPFLFVMNCADIIENFDSLWFFSNVVSSSRTEQSAHAGNEEDEVIEEAPKPKNQIEGEKQYESPNAENLVTKCPTCGEFSKEEVKEFAKPEEEKRKRRSISSRRRRSKRRSKRSLSEILGELDRLHLGFDYGNYMEYGLFDDEETITSGPHNQVLGSGIEYHRPTNTKMPSLDDNMAMKEHLKSWAYAVACTVK